MNEQAEKAPKEVELNMVEYGKAMLEHFYTKMLEPQLEEIKKAAVGNITFMDPDLVELTVEEALAKFIDELALKTNYLCQIVLGYVVAGRIEELKRFETLLLDLVERVLLKEDEGPK